MATRTETADDRFKLQVKAINQNIKMLTEAMAELTTQQTKDTANYGYASSAHKINQDLIDILQFMNKDGVKAPRYK